MDARVAAAEAAAPLEEQKKVMTECTGGRLTRRRTARRPCFQASAS